MRTKYRHSRLICEQKYTQANVPEKEHQDTEFEDIWLKIVWMVFQGLALFGTSWP